MRRVEETKSNDQNCGPLFCGVKESKEHNLMTKAVDKIVWRGELREQHLIAKIVSCNWSWILELEY